MRIVCWLETEEDWVLADFFPNGIGHYLAGGILLGVGVSLLFLTTGLIGGMSAAFSSTWSYVSQLEFFQQDKWKKSRQWRLVYAAGLILGALIYLLTLGGGETFVTKVAWWQLALGGFLAGFGARMGSGCTSGHGVCGLSSLQFPSLVAVCIFMTTAIVTANAIAWLGGT